MKTTGLVPASAGPEWTPRRVGRGATQLFLYCFIAYSCSYLGRKNFSACIPEMIEEEFLTKAFAGIVTTAFMLLYGMGQMVNGIVGSKVKPKYMIGVGLGGAGLCNIMMSIVPSAAPMPIIWALNGLFNSMLWAPIIRVFTDLLPPERRSIAGANIAPSSSVGAILAFLLPGLLLKIGNWRTVFLVSGMILLACCLLWITGNCFLSKYIKMMEEASRLERSALSVNADMRQPESRLSKPSRTRTVIVMVLGSWIILPGLLCNGALRDAVETWAPVFLVDQFALDSALASIISTIIPIVSIAGTYTAHWLNEKHIHNELRTSGLMFAIAFLSVVGLFCCRGTNAVLCSLFLAIGISAMWGANHMFLTVIPYHFASLGTAAAITGIFNGVIYFTTAVCSGLYGTLADKLGWDALVLIWMIIGMIGTLLCVFGAGIWSRKRTALDKGLA